MDSQFVTMIVLELDGLEMVFTLCYQYFSESAIQPNALFVITE